MNYLDLEVYENGVIKRRGKILNGEIMKNGYKRIHVSDNGVIKRYLVHRLIAEAFIPNPDNLPCINHKDGNKLNNSVENLEWCTYKENNVHAYKTGLKSAVGEKNGRSKLTKEDVLEIRKSYVKGKHTENNSRGLAKKYGVNPTTILDIVKGRNWAFVKVDE